MPHPPSPLSASSTSDQLASPRVHEASSEPEHGHLPGGIHVRARTMQRSILLPEDTYPNVTSPVVRVITPEGKPDIDVVFNDDSHAVAIRVHPALGHLPFRLEHEEVDEEDEEEDVDEVQLLSQILAEVHQAEKQAQQARSAANLDPGFPRILPAGDRYRDYLNLEVDTAPLTRDNKNLAQRYRAERVATHAHQLLTEAGLPFGGASWRALPVEALETAFDDRLQYHVSLWEPGIPVDDPDSPEGREEYDEQIRADWKNGDFDSERGATFIAFNEGREWLVWLDDRKVGYNLSTDRAMPGSPSEIFATLQRERPDALHGIDRIFVAPPLVSNALHALQHIAPERAHRILSAYCNPRGSSVPDMGFDQFGRAVQEHYPNVVVARYDRRAIAPDALGAMLDAFEGRVILVKLNNDDTAGLQEKFSLCFDRPGLMSGWNMDRPGDAAYPLLVPSPVAGTSQFRDPGQSPQQYLDAQRTNPLSALTYDARFRKRPDTMQRMPKASDSRMYNPSDYSGRTPKYVAPSAILRHYFDDCDQIGLIITGPLHADANADQAALAQMIEADEAQYFAGTLAYAGIHVDSTDGMTRTVYKTYGAWPEFSADLLKRCMESHNETLAPQNKIKVNIAVIESGASLPDVGESPAGYLLQFRTRGSLFTVLFYKSRGVAVFRGIFGGVHPVSDLNACARREGWWNEGAVVVVHFEGEDVRPLIEVSQPQQEPAAGPDGDERKRKRRVNTSSISSMGSDLTLRPRPKKVERTDQTTGAFPNLS